MQRNAFKRTAKNRGPPTMRHPQTAPQAHNPREAGGAKRVSSWENAFSTPFKTSTDSERKQAGACMRLTGSIRRRPSTFDVGNAERPKTPACFHCRTSSPGAPPTHGNQTKVFKKMRSPTDSLLFLAIEKERSEDNDKATPTHGLDMQQRGCFPTSGARVASEKTNARDRKRGTERQTQDVSNTQQIHAHATPLLRR